MKTVLVTGGAGYIGSHVVVVLQQAGYHVVVVDNLSNSKASVLQRIAQITGTAPEFYQHDCADQAAMQALFAAHAFRGVIHLAGLKAVGESCAMPLHYYQNNLNASMVLFEAMQRAGVMHLVFSSSATVYGDPSSVPIAETAPLGATNPYGRTKWMIEQMLVDLCQAPGSAWSSIALRYFNPVGAHPSGLIGEDPAQIPNNLMPYITQVAIGQLPQLSIFGQDYPTPDGTGVRDYLHVMDLAYGHLAALKKLETTQQLGFMPINLGTGQGHSVLEMVQAFERVTQQRVPYQIVARRPGDIASCYANPARAQAELQWQAQLGLEQMIRDAWNWQSHNPTGYPDA